MSNFSTSVIIGQGTNADIDTAEETVVEITDLPKLTKTQLTVYIATTLGTHTSMEYRFYYRHEVGGTYYARVKQNETDNTVDDLPVIIDSSSVVLDTGVYYTVYELPLSSSYALKITGKGAGGANGASTIKILARDN